MTKFSGKDAIELVGLAAILVAVWSKWGWEWSFIVAGAILLLTGLLSRKIARAKR